MSEPKPTKKSLSTEQQRLFVIKDIKLSNYNEEHVLEDPDSKTIIQNTKMIHQAIFCNIYKVKTDLKNHQKMQRGKNKKDKTPRKINVMDARDIERNLLLMAEEAEDQIKKVDSDPQGSLFQNSLPKIKVMQEDETQSIQIDKKVKKPQMKLNNKASFSKSLFDMSLETTFTNSQKNPKPQRVVSKIKQSSKPKKRESPSPYIITNSLPRKKLNQQTNRTTDNFSFSQATIEDGKITLRKRQPKLQINEEEEIELKSSKYKKSKGKSIETKLSQL